MKRAVLILILFVCSGCSSSLKYELQVREISIDTVPSGAQVYQVNYLDGSKTWLGKTPLQNLSVLSLARVKGKASPREAASATANLNTIFVVIEKEGYLPYRNRLGVKKGEVVAHTIVLEPKKEEASGAGVGTL